MSTVTQREPIDVTTLGAHLTALSKREYPPEWNELALLLAIAGQHTEHVSGCTSCRRWTDDPDGLGRCDDCAVHCDGCATEAESRDDLTLMSVGMEDRWLCEECRDKRAAEVWEMRREEAAERAYLERREGLR